MNQKQQAKKIRAINSEGRIFWSTVQERIGKVIEERGPQVLSDAVADQEDEARRRGLRETPSLEYFVERVSKRKLSPKKRGRPPETALRRRVNELRSEGKSWSQLKTILDKETKWPMSVSSYRHYAS
jgi:hypothetical protein